MKFQSMKNPVAGVAVGTLALLLTGGGIATVLQQAVLAAGAPPAIAVEAEAEAQTPALQTVSTPAQQTLGAAINGAPRGWKADGNIQSSQSAPFPYSCPVGGKAPAVSLSRSYRVSGTPIQVTVTAYTAGLGAEAMAERGANAYACAGSETPLQRGSLDVGETSTEAYLAQADRGAGLMQTVSLRTGDVITYITGSGSAAIQSIAVGYSEYLAPLVDPVCKGLVSTPEDASRSPWATSGYQPFTVPREVSIAHPGTPHAEGVKPVPIPTMDPVLEETIPAADPDYPFWPLMPSPVERPQAPVRPAVEPVLTQSIDALVNDSHGPGCGWAFTGMPGPVFDSLAADRSNTKLQDAAQARLGSGAKSWTNSVLTYWKESAVYEKNAAAYRGYAEKVSTVNAAWEAIDAQWDTYREAMVGYGYAKAAVDEFAAEQDLAREDYASAVDLCSTKTAAAKAKAKAAAEVEVEVEKPGRDDHHEDDQDDPDSAAEPEEKDEAPEPECKPERPEILEEPVPSLPVEPLKPADPRPEGQR